MQSSSSSSTRIKRKRAVAPDPDFVLPTPAPTTSEPAVKRQIECTPEIQAMIDIAHGQPNSIQVNDLSSSSSSSSSSPSSDSTKTMCRAQLHFDSSQQHPQMQELLRLRNNLIAPQYRVDGHIQIPTQSDVFRNLRVNALDLPVYTASHESMLLRQSGTFAVTNRGETRNFHFPPCMNGHQCVASRPNTIRGLPHDEPIIMMRAMSPSEFDHFGKTGVSPSGSAPCVLCHRDALCEYVYHVRAMMATGVVFEPDDPREVVQLWCNPISCENGYFHQYCIQPRPNEVVLHHLVEFKYHLLSARKYQGMWVIDQSAMVWRRPKLVVKPTVGENLQNFS